MNGWPPIRCSPPSNTEPPRRLARRDWQTLRDAHVARLQPWLAPYLEGRQRGATHPIFDFLFGYYSFRPAQLLRWSPGCGVVLEDGVTLRPADFPRPRVGEAERVLSLLVATAERPAQFGCSGLHEWAMLAGAGRPRHGGQPLRVSPATIDRVVREQVLCCTHFDAYRFFTAAARPLNRWELTRQTQPELEQPGCVHATMDLYKWAFKFSPWIASDLIADAFLLAWRAREMDMQASPYCWRNFGYEPIPVEEPAGRRRYQELQQSLTAAAQPVRARLIDAYRGLLGWLAAAASCHPLRGSIAESV